MSIWDEIYSIGKSYSVAEIGGFRPTPDIKSSFGGMFLKKIGEEWPTDHSGNMLPVMQICVSEVPNGKEIFGEIKLVQIFTNRDSLPQTFEAQNGNGWLLKEYDDIEGLEPIETPKEVDQYKSFQIKWQVSDKLDYPCWEESWHYIDMDEINDDDDKSDRYFDEFTSEVKTKIGGFGAYIQSPAPEIYEYKFQITSNDKTKFYVGHGGSLYIMKSKETGEWHLHWDCY